LDLLAVLHCCAGYENSFTKFIQSRSKFVCNLFMLHDDTLRDYYCSVNQNGRR
jgi:protein transport protein SEC24